MMPKKETVGLLTRAAAALTALAVVACGVGGAATSSDTPIRSSCVLIDTDFDIDDMMAIPSVIGNKYVAAMITSEGYTKPEMAASSLGRLTAEAGQRHIPIIVGASTNLSDASIITMWGDFVLQYRTLMDRLNNFMATALPPNVPGDRNYVKQVSDAVASCQSVDVLVIGTFSSFVQYSPAIRSKIGQVVVMGKPLEGDTSQTPGNYSFNCEYDMQACRQAYYEQLPGLNYAFVDVPRTSCDKTPNAPGCVGTVYGPNTFMVTALGNVGLPNTLKQVLLNNTESWDIDNWPNAHYGGKSLLWDQSAALYMIYPEIFAKVGGPGGHYETTLSPDAYRQKWTEATNMSSTFMQ